MAQDFFYEYFVKPIADNGWYNPFNTLVYGMLLVIGVYIVFRLLKRLKIGIDRHFLYAILPFIFWGSSTRVLHDASFAGALATPQLNAFYGSAIFPTPGSYIITFGLALLVLLISLVVQRYSRLAYWKAMAGIGVALCAINVWLTPIVTFVPLAMVLGFWALWTGMFWLVSRSGRLAGRLKHMPVLLSKPNLCILSAHFFDAAATFTALTFYGYWEQHVVPNVFIPAIGPVSMFLLKAVVVIPVLWAIDRYGEPGSFNNFLKIVVLILGLAPGLRDTIRLMAMV